MSRLQSLRVKWVITLLLVSLVGVSMVGLFTNRANTQEFDRLMSEEALAGYVDEVVTYYEEYGSWRAAALYFDPNRVGPMPERGSGTPPPPPSGNQPPGGDARPPVGGNPPPTPAGPPPESLPPAANGIVPGQRPENPDPNRTPIGGAGEPDFIIADANRTIVKPALGFGIGEILTDDKMQNAAPVVINRETVGYVLMTAGTNRLNEREQGYLQRTNEAILLAMFLATLMAMVIGVILANQLLAPIHELNMAIEGMRDGKLHQRIKVRSKDEIGKLGATFNEMSDEIARNQEMRRQMTSDIAHDLRTPLTVIAGYLEALRDGTFEPTEARFNAMYNETQALQFLVTDLNTLSKADNGSLRMNLEDVAPKDLISRVYHAFEVQAKTKQITVTQTVQENLPLVPMDMERMAQVLGNLVSNAMRYTPANGTIALSATRVDNLLRLKVSDTGSGISAEKLPFIFERFFRADESRSQIGHESGLGLAIARSLVEAHGGTIKAESEVGKGTTFTIDLPLVATLTQPSPVN
jgi:signal transduction histidine kinase